MGQQEDRAELVALMHAQRAAIWTGNYEAWAACFVQAPYTTRLGYWAGGGTFVRRGWDTISSRAKEHIERQEIPYNEDFAHHTTIEQLDLRIHGDMAWAVYKQQYPGYYYPGHIGPGLTDEFRIFERHDGRWKVAVMGFFDNNAGRRGSALVIVDGDGRVRWMSPEAQNRLAMDDDLVVRNGRLRIRNAQYDRKLQSAFRWAAALDEGYNSARGSVPIVMDAGEGLPTRVCWVKAEAGSTYFVFDGTPMTDERLDLAAVTFGLSAVQRRLAGHIADGLTLPEAAIVMRISVSTARAHLKRIFEKTGVHNQPALVRVLLLVGSPA